MILQESPDRQTATVAPTLFFQRNSAALQLDFTLRGAAQHVFGLQYPSAVPAIVLLAVGYAEASAAMHILKDTCLARNVKLAVTLVARRLGDVHFEHGLSAFLFRSPCTHMCAA